MKMTGDAQHAFVKNEGDTAADIMEDAPPIVAKKSSVEVVLSLLKHYPILIVAEKGKLLGVVTKSDLISKFKKE